MKWLNTWLVAAILLLQFSISYTQSNLLENGGFEADHDIYDSEPSATQSDSARFEQSKAFKMGIAFNDVIDYHHILSIECMVKRHISIQGTLGILPYLRYRNATGHYLGLYASVEVRQFLLWRKQPLQGLFIGLVGSVGHSTWYFPSRTRSSTLTWPLVGGILGGQLLLGDHVCLAAIVQVGYTGATYSRFYDNQGNFWGDDTVPLVASSNFQIQCGFKF